MSRPIATTSPSGPSEASKAGKPKIWATRIPTTRVPDPVYGLVSIPGEGLFRQEPPMSMRRYLYHGLMDIVEQLQLNLIQRLPRAYRTREYFEIAAAMGLVSVMDSAMLLNRASSWNPNLFAVMFGPHALNILDRWVGAATVQNNSKGTTNAQAEVRQWYNGRCVLTGEAEPTETCHIFPNAIETNPVFRTEFLNQLNMFWPNSQIDEALLQSPAHEYANLLVLRRDVGNLWDRHRFCLRPLDPDPSDLPGTLTLEFLWLSADEGNGLAPFSHNPDPPSPWRGPIAIPCSDGPQMLSGDRITLTTVNETEYPLPSRLLLTLQYNLQQALRAASSRDVLARLFLGGAENLIWTEPFCPAEHFGRFLVEEGITWGYIRESEKDEWLAMFTTRVSDSDSDGSKGLPDENK
ncbi:hypothetical protein GGS20DRAFT_262744 [Poronia punctata]|nr:hypothetical protein GGS20DRAFT_262744 [Poronia punctata]